MALIYVFAGEHLLCAKLRRANIDGAAGRAEVERIVAQIHEHFPTVKIMLRADSGFCCEELMRWCEQNAVDYVFGLAKNSRLVPCGFFGPLCLARAPCSALCTSAYVSSNWVSRVDKTKPELKGSKGMLRKTRFSAFLTIAIAAIIPCANAVDVYGPGDAALSIFSDGCVGGRPPRFRIWTANWGDLPAIRVPYNSVAFGLKKRSGSLPYSIQIPPGYPDFDTLLSNQCTFATAGFHYRIEVTAHGVPNQSEVSWVTYEQFAPIEQCPNEPQD